MTFYEEYLSQTEFITDESQHYDAYTETGSIDDHTEYSETHDDEA